MSLALWHWHIGITSKCTLRCPRCVRTEFPETVTNKELKLEFFQKNFTEEFILNNVERVSFCGNDGDPIYAHDLIPIIKYFKSIKPVSIAVVTNGSYKKSKWWAELGRCLTDIDQVHFSVDGYDNESNNIYRVNSDWNSIINGAKVLRRTSDCYMSWSSILFKFNQDRIEDIKQTAKKIGFDQFQLTQSTKFNKYNKFYPENDPLQPEDSHTIEHGVYERRNEFLSYRRMKEPYKEINKRHFEKTQTIKNVFPLCFTGLKGVYIDADGYFYPCCWVANQYPHNKIWHSRRVSLYDNNLADVVKNEYWNEKFIEGSLECIHKCSKKYSYDTYNSRDSHA